MLGACFIIDNIELIKPAKAPETSPSKKNENDEIKEEAKNEALDEGKASDIYGPFSGQVISIVKDLCKKAFLNADPRIAEGVYLCSM